MRCIRVYAMLKIHHIINLVNNTYFIDYCKIAPNTIIVTRTRYKLLHRNNVI